jgi:hypothetical protein
MLFARLFGARSNRSFSKHATIAWAPLAVTVLCGVAAMAQGVPPIHLDPVNPHYFQYEGKTIALVSSGEHYGAVLNRAFDGRTYLKTLAAEGLNYTRLFGGPYVEVPGQSFGIRHNDLAPSPGELLLPWKRSTMPGYAGGGDKFDLSQWNPAYFARLHRFLNDAERRGIVVEITLFSSYYGDAQWAVSPLNPRNNVNHLTVAGWKQANTLKNGNLLGVQERYVRKMAEEANAYPNVIFEIQNEPWSDHPEAAGVVNAYLWPPARDKFPNAIQVADAASMAWQTRVAQWITSEEARLPNRHLVAENICDFGVPVRALIPGVNVVNFHYAYPAAARVNQGLDKPIAYDETGFLGQKDGPYLRQAWNFLLSGGGSFGALDYSFTVAHPDGEYTQPNGPGGGSANLRRELGILARFLRTLPLRQMRVAPAVVQSGGGTYARVLASARVIAVYFDGSGPATVTLRLAAGRYAGEWLDPETGTAVAIAPFASDRQSTLHAPQFAHGIALRLSRED